MTTTLRTKALPMREHRFQSETDPTVTAGISRDARKTYPESLEPRSVSSRVEHGISTRM
jgi:hypothetical protein